MSNEHKEQAREIAKRYTREGTGYADRLYQLAYAIGQALSSRDTEIREVLEGLASLRRYDHGQPERCWCDADDPETPHMPACLAARELYAKVQPGG